MENMNTIRFVETIYEINTDSSCDDMVHDSIRQSCSNLPISTRKDRFKNRYEYSQMYSYNGLNDIRHYLSIKRVLKTINQWNFNIFALERFSAGSPLTYLSIHLFEVHDIINHFKLDIFKLYQFFMIIEKSYHPSNPYHNALHAADVTQAINCIIQDKKIWSQLSKKDILCSLLSTICHDVDHPGVNNMFMNNSQHHLAALYQKESVLENHHWAFSLSVLKETELFSHLDTSTWKSVTEICRSLIRATDISKQNTYLSDFNESLIPVYVTRNETLNEADKLLVLQMAIKCADICNPCRRWDICNCWAYLVTEEFFQQGDRERKLALPVSPIMDREKTRLAIVQKDFIGYLVQPLFRVWDQFIHSDMSRNFLTQIDSNQSMWQLLASKSSTESDNIILHSIQSLYDRMQLMHVMDYTKDHQLSHLQRLRLLIDANYLEEESRSHVECAQLDDNRNFDPDMIQEGHTKLYYQCRRGSLPITLLSSNRDNFSANISRKTNLTNRQNKMQRRTSLQPRHGFMSNNRGGGVHNEVTVFPTAGRRQSAPVLKANTVSLFDTIANTGRRGSLTSYFCSNKLVGASALCSSQSQLYYHHANSMNDIQIPQVG